MLNFPRPSALKLAKDKDKDRDKEFQRQEEERDRSPEDMPPTSARSSRSKRNSGMFDIGHTQLQKMKDQDLAQVGAIQRRTSKRASSQDRRGQVYGDEVPAFRPETPDVTVDLTSSQISPRGDDVSTISPRRGDPSRYELPLRDRVGDSAAVQQARDNLARPRTRTLEERIRSRSPQTSRQDNRKRIGSFQAGIHPPLQEDPVPGNSIGYPTIIPGSSKNLASASRQLLIQTPPRPLSPSQPASGPSSSGSPVSDAERILRLMRFTGGRMHGILYFRLSKTSSWQSGYCAINVGTGSLIYQTKGELAQTKTLIPDLSGCKVRTQYDHENQSPFLEMSTRSSGMSIHLRPLLPETFDSWLAALLCWQPLKSSPQNATSTQPRRLWRSSESASASGQSTPISSSTIERAPSRTQKRIRSLIDIYAPLRKSPEVDHCKILWWDLSVPQSTPIAPPRRISTYKQMRMSAGPPWRKATTIVRENGLLEIVLDHTKDQEGGEWAGALKAAVDMSTLTRYSVQRLHPSVLDDEFCLAVYAQYKYQNHSESDSEPDDVPSWPIFLSFENRTMFELWYAMLRSFTVPEIYGTSAKALYSAGELKPQQRHVPLAKDMFRVKRSLQIRIIEAQLHGPRPNTESKSVSGGDPLVGDYHAEVQIDNETRGRTAIQTETSTPFWREDYDFNHLPPLTGQAVVLIKSRHAGQRDWTLISGDRYIPEEFRDADHLDMVEDIHISALDSVHGSVELNLADIERATDIEKWWQIQNEFGDVVGKLLMKVRLDESVILMSKEYEELGTMLLTFSNGLATDVMDKCLETTGRLAETLLNIFQVSGSACRWISTMVEDEIDSLQRDVSASRYRFSRRIASNDSYDSGVERELVLRDMGKSASVEANLLFRGNTPLTKALELHMRRLGKEFLEAVLGERMRDIDESEPECEVDPNKLQSPEALQRNWRNLILLTESIWRSIYQGAHKCPPELRQLFRHIRSCCEDRYGAFLRTVSYSSVSAFLFLRLLVPAILNPSLFGLLKEMPRPKSRRTLTMIAKSLQTLANMTTFGAKEPWMEPMNAFLNSHRQEFKDYIDDVCGISQERGSNASQPNKDYAVATRIAQKMPEACQDGNPSLPFLIDQPREYATLVHFWTAARGQTGSIPIVNEDLARFDVVCDRLHQHTKGLLMKAAEEGPVDASGNDWQRLIAQLEMQEKNDAGPRSGVMSPASPPARAHQREASVSSQDGRPKPSRSSTVQSASGLRMNDNRVHQVSEKSSLNFPAATGAGDSDVNSPSGEAFTDVKRDGDDDSDSESDSDEDIDSPPDPTSLGNRDRAGTVPTVGSGGYMHPLAWDDGSTGSGRSKPSSLRSIDTDAANSAIPGTDGRSPGSSALPWSAGLKGKETGPSPMISPKDPEIRRLVDVLSFGRRKKDRGDKDKDREKEREREKEEIKKARKKEAKERKRQDKERGKDRIYEAGPSNGTGGNQHPPEAYI